jgi:SpoVK/Ycf46/Vps4 family AAA+-type ATPase
VSATCPTERLDSAAFAAGEPIAVVYGPGVGDVFVGADMVRRGLREVLWERLREAGFERIVFSTLGEPMFTLDEASRAAEPPAAARPAERTRMRTGFVGPMGSRRLAAGVRSGADGGGPATGSTMTAAAATTAPATTRAAGSHTAPLTQGSQTHAAPAQAPNGSAAPGVMAAPTIPAPGLTDEHLLWQVDHLMRQSTRRTAVVFLQGEEALEYLDAQRTFAARVADWIERHDEALNLCIFVFPRSSPAAVRELIREQRAVPRLAAYLEDPSRAAAMPCVGYPATDEVERLVEAVRLTRGLRIADWRRVSLAIVGMAGQHTLLRTWEARLRQLAAAGEPFGPDALRRRGWVSRAASAAGSAWAELEEMVGLDQVKQRLEGLRWEAEAARRQAEAGRDMPRSAPSLHMAFLGSAGTGKSTAARLMGEILRDAGLLSRGNVVEVNAKDLAGSHEGATGPRVDAKVDEALGGVLFIDEAYALDGDRNYAPDVRNALVARMENDRHRLVVILAGYRAETRRMIAANPGMRSRIPEANELTFPDLEPAELIRVLHQHLRGVDLAPGAFEHFERLVHAIYEARDPERFGNAREMRDLAYNIRTQWATRVRADVTRPVTAADAPGYAASLLTTSAPPVEELLSELDRLVGLGPVKQAIDDLVSMYALRGAGRTPPPAPHCLFLGPPGTGKSTVAGIYGRILVRLGLLRRGHVVVRSGSSLQGQYLGQTAPKVLEAIEEARGGVLLLDEAYGLMNGPDDLYGRQAVATLVNEMERQRGRFVLIAAGYPAEMKAFLKANAGLGSRFEKRIEFPAYSDEDLLQVLDGLAAAEGIRITPEAAQAARRWLGAKRRADGTRFGNARTARNLFREMYIGVGRRYRAANGPTDLILAEDVPRAGS